MESTEIPEIQKRSASQSKYIGRQTAGIAIQPVITGSVAHPARTTTPGFSSLPQRTSYLCPDRRAAGYITPDRQNTYVACIGSDPLFFLIAGRAFHICTFPYWLQLEHG